MKKIIGILLLAMLVASNAFAASLVKSPTTCSGGWNICFYSHVNDATSATATPSSSTNITGTWSNYGFFLSSSDTVNSVAVRADAFASRTSGFIALQVSGDGGATYGPAHIIGGNTAEQQYYIDVTSDVAWTPTTLRNGNLTVKATAFKNGGGANPTVSLEWLPVNVTYTPFFFTLSRNPTSGTVLQGESAQTVLTTTLVSGTPQPVQLTVLNCPTGATCTLSNNSQLPTYTSTLTIATINTTPTGVYNVNVTAIGGGKSDSTVYTLTVA